MAISVEHPDNETLTRFVLGEFGPQDDATELEKHIVNCQECCSRLALIENDQFTSLVRNRGTTHHSAAWETAGLRGAEDSKQTQSEDDAPVTAAGNTSDRYEMKTEIARGGMGAVYHGFDRQLGREVAIKVVLSGGRADVRLRRFVKEAQITGQLQHPGVPPVYELGRLPDMRPFIAMKYVSGDTLRTLFDRRVNRISDLPRLLDAFEQLCQTVGFAHTQHHIVHRDLKPNNIMVGKHGETQVMDWGIAKVLGAHEHGTRSHDSFNQGVFHDAHTVDAHTIPPSDESDAPIHDSSELDADAESDRKTSTGSQIELDQRTTRTYSSEAEVHSSNGDWSNVGQPVTRVGAVLGTPAYMPPEQAQGDITEVDERIDVFALGAILCEILTGKAPYDAPLIQQVLVMAQRADQKDAIERLEKCHADRELVELTMSCLAPNKEDRPRHAGKVADRVTEYLRSTQQKLRNAEIERAQAAVQMVAAKKSRKARILTIIVLAVASGVLFSSWYYSDQRRQRIASDLNDMLKEARKHMERGMESSSLSQFETARDIVADAHRIAEQDDTLIEKVEAFEIALMKHRQQAAKDLTLLKNIPSILGDHSLSLAMLRRNSANSDRNGKGEREPSARSRGPKQGVQVDAQRITIAVNTFRVYGFPVGADAEKFASYIATRPSFVEEGIVASLDVWFVYAADLANRYANSDRLADYDNFTKQATWISQVLSHYDSLQEPVKATVDSSTEPSKQRERIRDGILKRDKRALLTFADYFTNDQESLAKERTSVIWGIAGTLARPFKDEAILPEHNAAALQLLQLAQLHHLDDYLLNKELGEAYLHSDSASEHSDSFMHFMLASVSRNGTGNDGRLYQAMCEFLKNRARRLEIDIRDRRLNGEFSEYPDKEAAYLAKHRRYLQEALAMLIKTQRRFPNHRRSPQRAATIGRLHLELNDPENAISRLEEALDGKPEDAQFVHQDLGRCYEQLSDYPNAIDHYEKAIVEGEISERNFRVDAAIKRCKLEMAKPQN